MAMLPIASWFLVRKTRELPPVIAASGGPQPKAWDLLRQPMFRRLLLVNWFLSSCWDVHTFVVPVLGHERGISASVIGTILGAFAVAAALIRMVLPLVGRPFARVEGDGGVHARDGGAVRRLSAHAFGHRHGPVLHPAGLCAGHGAAHGDEHAAPDHAGGAPRRGAGLRLMAINASSVAMPMLFGSAGALIGIAGVFWFAAQGTPST
jgi:hypothetical protein